MSDKSVFITEYKSKHNNDINNESDELKQIKIDQSYDNRIADDDANDAGSGIGVNDKESLRHDENDLSSGKQEKEVVEEVDLNNTVLQIGNPLNSFSSKLEISQSITVHPKRFRFLSILPCFPRRRTESKKPQTRALKVIEILKFADKFDIILMIIGTIAAILTGVLQPFLMSIFRRVTNSLADYEKGASNATMIISTNFSECVIVSPNNTDTPQEAINKVIKYYVLLGFLSILFYWIAWSTWIITSERQIRRIRYALFRNILRQEIGWFDVHNAGELGTCLIDNLDKIKDGINEKVPDFICLLSRLICLIIYSFSVGWKLTLVYLSASPFVVILFNITVKVIVKYTIKEAKAFALAGSIVQDVLSNIRTVTAFHGQIKEEERFANHLIQAKKFGLKKGLYMGICQGLQQILTYVSLTITLWYGLQLVQSECTNYTGGSLIVILFSCMNGTISASQFIPNFQNFGEALGSGSLIFDLIKQEPKIDASSDEGDEPKTIIGDIEFDNVTFTYPARQEASILSNLSFKIPSGKTVALVGASGCGKSTTIQLIQRFYDPDEGRVLLDGKDIKTLNVAWLRSHIGIVSQEPVLFTESIEDNIRFGKKDATDEEVQRAAKMANAHDFIMALPENYKTSAGDKLSGGQKQRVAIARALISNPKILLLDEATSALDNTSERVVQDALDKAKEGRTTIVIAHRLSTICNADLIIGLEHGQVVEYGTHDNLMEQKGLYYELVTTQAEKEKEKEAEEESNSEEDEETEIESSRQRSVNRRFSDLSSVSSVDLDEEENNDDEATSNDPLKKKRLFRTPFIWKILKLNTPEWSWILLGSICSIICGATQSCFGLFFSYIYRLSAEQDLEKQKNLTSIYAGVIFVVGFVTGLSLFLSTFGFAKSGEALTMRMRKLTFAAMLRQEMGYFDQESNSIGALVTRLSTDASSIKALTGVRIGFILQAISALVAALVIAFESGWKLSLVVLCFVPLLIFGGKIQGQKQGKAGQLNHKDSYAEQGGQHATQAIEHIRTVVALHQEQHFIDLYEDAFNREFKKQMLSLHKVSLGAAIAWSMLYFLQCAIFGYGSKLVENGEMKFDEVFRVFAVNFGMIAVGRSMAMIPDFSKAKNAASRIIKLNKRQSQINPHDQSGIIPKEIIGNIEFVDIHFRYPSRPTIRVLKNFTLKCLSSQTTAFVGSSGSGKSTTIGLLQRFYDPLKGKVLLDGHDIKVLNIQWLRSLMGLVQQEPVLFDLSIRDNIAYGDNSREVTQQEIEAAARMANIHQLIISLPKGYDTLCGAKGSQLSGGQKQRIAIARTLVRSPKILLLDEATSALDTKSEKVVQTVLNNARSGRTCLTIAHRLTTIQNSEKIAVVDRGRLKEEGTHQELLALGGTYAKLALTQERSI